MSDSLTTEVLSDLLNEVAHRHHETFISSDGIDPDWAMWYAGFLQAKLFPYVDEIPSRSSLIHMLVQADIDHQIEGGLEWTPIYAADMLPKITGA